MHLELFVGEGQQVGAAVDLDCDHVHHHALTLQRLNEPTRARIPDLELK